MFFFTIVKVLYSLKEFRHFEKILACKPIYLSHLHMHQHDDNMKKKTQICKRGFYDNVMDNE